MITSCPLFPVPCTQSSTSNHPTPINHHNLYGTSFICVISQSSIYNVTYICKGHGSHSCDILQHTSALHSLCCIPHSHQCLCRTDAFLQLCILCSSFLLHYRQLDFVLLSTKRKTFLRNSNNAINMEYTTLPVSQVAQSVY